MAGHLPISLTEDTKATAKVNQIIGLLGLLGIKNMTYFQRVKCCGVTMQRLSPEYRMDDNTEEVFCIINWHFKQGEEDEFEGGIIEVHLDKKGQINQLYFVA